MGTSPATVSELGEVGADSHLRQLCASCHVGATKVDWGPVDERSRGGGCNGCHLSYGSDALSELRAHAKKRGTTANSPFTHPNISLGITSAHCFGCHSRSGRISTSYDGWMETEPTAAAAGGRYRTLQDGRVFRFVQADVHSEKGMECIDCHTFREVMGDGLPHARKADALRVACEDCHFAVKKTMGLKPRATTESRTIAGPQLDGESRKIATLRGRTSPHDTFLVSRGGDPLLNTSIDASGKPWLTTKSKGARLELRSPAPVCVEGDGHARLSCESCHTAWAPRCTRCHTRFDAAAEGFDLLDQRPTRGAWIEKSAGFSAQQPTLGVRQINKSTNQEIGKSVIETFTPGMILTLDRNQLPDGRPDNVFRRLYARASPHTTSKGGRTCQSCHNDPVAIGYGEGKLVYDAGRGTWRFTPSQPSWPDGLPADAWVGFLQERGAGASTRPDVRPFTIDEQKRILTVGACLTCHEAMSAVMRRAVTNWKGMLARTSRRCVLPKW